MSKIRMIDALFVQAGIAAALSFSHIHDVAVACGQGRWQAWAYPISVDLLLFAAWRRLRRGEGGRQEWVWFCVALVASLGANLATAGLMQGAPPEWLSLMVAGWPALAFLGGTLLVHKSGKEATEAEPEAEPEAEQQAEAQPETPQAPVHATPIVPLPANVVPFSPPVPHEAPVNATVGVRKDPEAPAPKKSRAEAAEIIEMAWKNGISVEEAAKSADRHPVSVRRHYKKLDERYGKVSA